MSGNGQPCVICAKLGQAARAYSTRCADCAMRGGGTWRWPPVLRRLRHAHTRQKSDSTSSYMYVSRTLNGFPLPDARARRNRRSPGTVPNYFMETPQ